MAYDEELAERIRGLVQEEAGITEMRGRRMRGWLHVGIEGLENEDQLERWVARGVA